MYLSKRFTRTKFCPVCGRQVMTDFFGGHCGSTCVEIAVDEAIERRHEMQEREDDRNDNY